MLTFILVEIGFFALSLISSYLTWGPLTSPEMVDYFGPVINTKEEMTEKAWLERRRKAGMFAEVLRAALITLFGIIVIPFYSSSIDIRVVIENPFYQWSFVVIIILVVMWNGYFGPKFFAIRYSGGVRYFSKEHFVKYVRPYLVWMMYPLFIFGGIGLLTFAMILGGLAEDIGQLQIYVTRIKSVPLLEIEDVQFALIHLREFARFVSSISQKYVLTTLLIFIYVVIEQRSSMRHTILDTSVERLKYAVWTGLLFTIGFALVVLPLQYDGAMNHIQDGLVRLTVDRDQLVADQHLGDVLSVQQFLEDHDLQWLMLQIVTGFGNLFTAAIIGLSVFVWRLFFDKVPVRYIVRLVVPKYIIERMNRLAEDFSIDINLKDDK